MKQTILISAFIFTAVPVCGQVISLSYAPTSVQGWGDMPQTSLFITEVKVPADYWINDYVSIGLIHVQTQVANDIILKTRSGEVFQAGKINNPWGLFVKPLVIEEPLWIFTAGFSAGVIYFTQPIPVKEGGKRINFIFTLALKKKLLNYLSIGLAYTHVSNAFRGAVNPGYDFPSVTIGVIL